MDDLDGRVAVVTGGASGIGAALVAGFSAAGMRTLVADIDLDGAKAVAAEASAGADSIAVRVDVADVASVVALADTAYEAFGAVHVLCNNAGVLLFKGFGDSIIEDWQWVYGVNVMGTINGVIAFLPRMQAGGEAGHIFNTSSIAALGATGIYGTSKAAILTLTDALADELADTPIRASALLPGMVRSLITDAERNRPADKGRKVDDPTREFAGLVGLDPATCAERVLEALHTGERYVFAGIPEGAFDLETAQRRRFDELMSAIDAGIVPEPTGDD
ncbi:MAG: SDR family NAD(P)-dependent oxidoreductase [Acidimicrobiia bacterium]|nr:SDR family NAD(P)-dependent oxidoreductase [Acidimicrobiia bacterium]